MLATGGTIGYHRPIMSVLQSTATLLWPTLCIACSGTPEWTADTGLTYTAPLPWSTPAGVDAICGHAVDRCSPSSGISGVRLCSNDVPGPVEGHFTRTPDGWSFEGSDTTYEVELRGVEAWLPDLASLGEVLLSAGHCDLHGGAVHDLATGELLFSAAGRPAFGGYEAIQWDGGFCPTRWSSCGGWTRTTPVGVTIGDETVPLFPGQRTEIGGYVVYAFRSTVGGDHERNCVWDGGGLDGYSLLVIRADLSPGDGVCD